MVNVSPSSSVSFSKTEILTVLSSSKDCSSATARGSSLIGKTVTSTVDDATPPLPSEML